METAIYLPMQRNVAKFGVRVQCFLIDLHASYSHAYHANLRFDE